MATRLVLVRLINQSRGTPGCHVNRLVAPSFLLSQFLIIFGVFTSLLAPLIYHRTLGVTRCGEERKNKKERKKAKKKKKNEITKKKENFFEHANASTPVLIDDNLIVKYGLSGISVSRPNLSYPARRSVDSLDTFR